MIVTLYSLTFASVPLLVLLLLKYVASYWKIYILAICVMAITTQLLGYFIPESPKQLLSQGKLDKVEESLKEILRINTFWDKSLNPKDLERHLSLMRDTKEEKTSFEN